MNSSLEKMVQYIQEKGVKKFIYNYDIEIDNELTPQTWSKKYFNYFFQYLLLQYMIYSF